MSTRELVLPLPQGLYNLNSETSGTCTCLLPYFPTSHSLTFAFVLQSAFRTLLRISPSSPKKQASPTPPFL